MLQAIAVGLQWLKDSLASTMFTEAWQKLTSQINQFLFEELILQRQFNDGGAAQLCFDSALLLYIFYCKWNLYFEQTNDFAQFKVKRRLNLRLHSFAIE